MGAFFRGGIERRPDPERIAAYRIGAVLLGLAVSLLLAPSFSGVGYSTFYTAVWNGTLGTSLGFSNVLTIAIPLTLAGLAASIPFRFACGTSVSTVRCSMGTGPTASAGGCRTCRDLC